MARKTNFKAIKAKILERSAASGAAGVYKEAHESKTLCELCGVIKEYFKVCCNLKIITSDLLEAYREDFAQNDIFINVSVKSGCLLCNSGTVKARGGAVVVACGEAVVETQGRVIVEARGNAFVRACHNTIVRAFDNSIIEAYGNAMVTAFDYSIVRAWGDATVAAYDNSVIEAHSTTIKARDYATVKARDHSIVEAYDYAIVKACDHSIVEAYGPYVTINACGNARCTSYDSAQCKLTDSAINVVINNAQNIETIYYSDNSINFIKQ